MLLPDHETEVDFLNYEAIADTVVALLKDNRQRAMTIGIHGDWGAGKSSVLKMIEAGLDDEKDVACLWFNGWTFQGFDDAKTVLIEETINELLRQRSGYAKVKDIGQRLLKRIDWLKVAKKGSGLAFNVLTGLPSPDQIGSVLDNLSSLGDNVSSLSPEQIQAKLSEAATFLKPGEERSVPTEIHQFRIEFSELLEAAKIKQLVVLIDDLDRCLPSTAIDTLEAIRLFLFVPKTAFVIGADEAMIEYAVKQHFPDLPVASGPMPYARNYLEKLVQVPFRIPALGIEETRIYVTLLLIDALVGEKHKGFGEFLEKAKRSLNQPWIGEGLTGEDLKAVSPEKETEINAASLVAQQIGPILAEGTKGNPRQVKRFLNAMLIRQLIAQARGFGDSINQSVLAKLMLAERFQPDFYELIATQSMISKDGKVSELKALEKDIKPGGKKKEGKKATQESEVEKDPDRLDEKWLGRTWLQQWAKIEPPLAGVDLRPYVFVARDKRILGAASAAGSLQGLIETLCGPEMAVRGAEPEVKSLPQTDADAVFGTLKERALRTGDFTSQPSGLLGMCVVAKHHTRFQTEIITLLGSVEPKKLGVWAVRGWNEYITEADAKEQLRARIQQWAEQGENPMLKKAAGIALSALNEGAR